MLLSYRCFGVWAGKLQLEKLRPKKLGFTTRQHVSNFSFFLNPSGLIYPILVYHNFRGKSNFRRSGVFCRTLILTGEIWQGALAQNLPISPFWICLLEIGGSLVSNQSLLQTEFQSKTRTPALRARMGQTGKMAESNNLTTPKIWQRRRAGFYRERVLKARNTKPIISL